MKNENDYNNTDSNLKVNNGQSLNHLVQKRFLITKISLMVDFETVKRAKQTYWSHFSDTHIS